MGEPTEGHRTRRIEQQLQNVSRVFVVIRRSTYLLPSCDSDTTAKQKRALLSLLIVTFYFIFPEVLFLVLIPYYTTHKVTDISLLLHCTPLPNSCSLLFHILLFRTRQAFLGRDLGDGINATRPLAHVLLLVLAEEGARPVTAFDFNVCV